MASASALYNPSENSGRPVNQPDLAFLLGVHPGVIQRLMQEHDKVVLPTHGNMADMGPGLSHIAKIVGLMDRGMPLPLIRKTIGCSMKLVEKHAALYQRYKTPDCQFTLMQLRRALENTPTKKGI